VLSNLAWGRQAHGEGCTAVADGPHQAAGMAQSQAGLEAVGEHLEAGDMSFVASFTADRSSINRPPPGAAVERPEPAAQPASWRLQEQGLPGVKQEQGLDVLVGPGCLPPGERTSASGPSPKFTTLATVPSSRGLPPPHVCLSSSDEYERVLLAYLESTLNVATAGGEQLQEARRSMLIHCAPSVSISERWSRSAFKSCDVWRWADMLLNDDVHAFAPRPLKLLASAFSVPAIFRDEGSCRRTQGSDRWTNSGGIKGSSIWPNSLDTALLRCKYGRVVVESDPSIDFRFRMYTFVSYSKQATGRQSRRLYVLTAGKGSRVGPIGAATTAGLGCNRLVDCHGVVEIDRLLASLESQAAASAHRVDIEAIHQLLTVVGDLPYSENHTIWKCERPDNLIWKSERPDVVDGRPFKRIFVEAEVNRRRKRARAATIAKTGPPAGFDKWTNLGGKRGIVTLTSKTGTLIQRRAGRIIAEKAGGVALRYYQYSLEPKSTEHKSSTPDTLTMAKPRPKRRNSGTNTVFVFHAFEDL
jgi:hypothetical protein